MYISRGVRLFFFKVLYSFCMNIFFILTNSVDTDELQHFAAFIWVFTVCKSTCLAVSHIQKINLIEDK